jgi:hypothetical protein
VENEEFYQNFFIFVSPKSLLTAYPAPFSGTTFGLHGAAKLNYKHSTNNLCSLESGSYTHSFASTDRSFTIGKEIFRKTPAHRQP